MTKLQVQPHKDHDFNIMKIEILGLKQLSSINSNSISSQAIQLHRLKLEEEQRLEEAREAEEAALKLAEKETQNVKQPWMLQKRKHKRGGMLK